MGRLRLFIFHLRAQFGAKMLIDVKIMTKNRNSRWRPSAILELLHHNLGPPTKSFRGFWRYGDFIFLQKWLEMPIYAPKFRFLGSGPLHVIDHHRDPRKAHTCALNHMLWALGLIHSIRSNFVTCKRFCLCVYVFVSKKKTKTSPIFRPKMSEPISVKILHNNSTHRRNDIFRTVSQYL